MICTGARDEARMDATQRMISFLRDACAVVGTMTVSVGWGLAIFLYFLSFSMRCRWPLANQALLQVGEFNIEPGRCGLKRAGGGQL
jgi:hypothetical protein